MSRDKENKRGRHGHSHSSSLSQALEGIDPDYKIMMTGTHPVALPERMMLEEAKRKIFEYVEMYYNRKMAHSTLG